MTRRRAPPRAWARAWAVAGAAWAGAVHAQTPTAPQQVVVEARPLSEAEQRRNSTVAMTVLGRDELDQHGDTSVLDLLQRQPGITLDGELPRLRGLGGGYTLILLNGEPAPPGFSLDTLAPGDIERIEIIKGPTAEHGGVAGSINVILRAAPRLRQREARASLGYRALGPQGSASFSWGDRVGALGFQLPVSVHRWVNAAGARAERVSRPTAALAREDLQLSSDRWRGGGLNVAPRLDWKLGVQDTLQWQGFAQRSESGYRSQRATEGRSGPPPYTTDDRAQTFGVWQMLRTQAQWTRRWPEGARLELKAGLQGSLSRSAGHSGGLDGQGATVVQREVHVSHRERMATQGGRLRLPLAGAHTLLAGWDLQERHRRELRRQIEDYGQGATERLDGSVGVPFTVAVHRVTVFAQDEWTPGERWSVMAGLRAERARLVSAGRGQPVANAQTAVSPLLHLRRAFDAAGREVLRASLARSIRVPDIGLLLPRYVLNGNYEPDQANTPLAPDSAGNPALQAERSTGFELAYERQLAGGGVASVGVFHRRIEGLIRRRIALETVAEAAVPRWVSRPSNIGSARSSGLELELKGRGAQLLPAGWVAPRSPLQLRAAVSLYRSAVEQIDDPDARLEGQQPWSATVGFDDALAASGWTYGASLALTPAFSTQQTDRQRVWRGASRRLDAFVAWRVDRLTQWRLAGHNLAAPDARSASSVTDLDGYTAGNRTQRQTRAQLTLSLVSRF